MEIALSMTELEFTVLIQAMRDIISFIFPMRKVSFIFDINIPKPEVFS